MRRLRPVRVALQNQRDTLLAFAGVLDAKLAAIAHAHAKISRMLDRLDLVRAQITALKQERDAVLENKAPDRAGEMIQQLASLRGIGVQSATVLVREAFVREFAVSCSNCHHGLVSRGGVVRLPS